MAHHTARASHGSKVSPLNESGRIACNPLVSCRKPDINEALDEVACGLSQLVDRIDGLADRLTPVLSTDGIKAEALCVGPRAPRSPLGELLTEQRMTVDRLIDRVNEILDRLQI